MWKWDKFLRLYYDLEQYIRFLDVVHPHISRYQEADVNQLSETELVSCIVAIEKVLEENYSKAYGWFYLSEKNLDAFPLFDSDKCLQTVPYEKLNL